MNLKVRSVGEKALRIRGKGDKDRTIPLTERLTIALRSFCSSKNSGDSVLSVGEGVIYRVVKKYGRLAGKPELKPHDLRHAFATRLLEKGVNIRVVQELLGHSNLNTTQVYTAVSGLHLEDAIRSLDETHQPTVTVESTMMSEDRIKSLLHLSILEGGRRVIDDKTEEYARLVKFRLGNTSDKPIIIERICLEVVGSETGDFRPSIEGLITPHRYDVELRLADPGEYTITEDKFKLSKDDMDDFEVLCTAINGLNCHARVKVYYTRYPDTEILTECSALLHLTFPEGRSKPEYIEAHKYIIAESLGDNLGTLANYKNCLPNGTEGELRVYLVDNLSDVSNCLV